MVIGWLPGEGESAGPSSAWGRIDAAQRSARLPCLLVPQPAHAVLAGEIAAIINEEAFDDLDGPIVRLTSLDTPVPFSPPQEEFFLPKVSDLVREARRLHAY